MSIDFIKWLLNYAEGFKIRNEGSGIFPDWIIYYNNSTSGVDSLAGDFNKTAESSLLLQKAIEGINKSDLKYKIFQNNIQIIIWDSKSCFYIPEIFYKYQDFKSMDEAKEAALKYIYEQGKK